MNGFILLLLLYLTINLQSVAAILYSRSDGNWSNIKSWSTSSHRGPSCNCTPAGADKVYIDHNINLSKSLVDLDNDLSGVTGTLYIKSGGTLNGGNKYDIDIGSTGTLYLDGNLVTRNLTIHNQGKAFICTSGILNLFGELENKNDKDNITINGTVNVHAAFTNKEGGAVSGSGIINIETGPIINNGSIMGCTRNPCMSFPCVINSHCATPQHVELITFEANSYNNYVRIFWRTAKEKNNAYFILEKSLDGKVYSKLSKVKGNGNSLITRNYAYRDLYPRNGNNYYRLTQYDFEGNFQSYYPINIAFRKNLPLSVHHIFPLPKAWKKQNQKNLTMIGASENQQEEPMISNIR